MVCYIAYKNNIASIVKPTLKEARIELTKKDKLTGKRIYLPGKYVFKKVKIVPDEEFGYKTIALKTERAVIVR